MHTLFFTVIAYCLTITLAYCQSNQQWIDSPSQSQDKSYQPNTIQNPNRIPRAVDSNDNNESAVAISIRQLEEYMFEPLNRDRAKYGAPYVYGLNFLASERVLEVYALIPNIPIAR